MAMIVINIYWDDQSKSFIPLTRMPDGDIDLEESIYIAPGAEAQISDPPMKPAALVGVKVAAI